MLRFAVSGIPATSKKPDVFSGLERLRDLGLDGMEMAWVQGVNTTPERAARVKQKAEELDLTLTVHGSYYINLNAAEPLKREASAKRLFEACYIGGLAGAKSVAFHAAYYLGGQPEPVFQNVKTEIEKVRHL